MRAKNEFRNIAANYDTKLILERVVDGKLMCPEACCGAPVVECTCGPDCPHCNCFMIHKAMKEKGFTNKLLKENKKLVSEGLFSRLRRKFKDGPEFDKDTADPVSKEVKPAREPVRVTLGPAKEPVRVTLRNQKIPETKSLADKVLPITKAAATKAGAGLGKAATAYTAIDDFVMAPDAHAPGVDQPGKWFMPDRLTHSATGRPAPTKSIISKTKDLIPTIKPENAEEFDGTDAGECESCDGLGCEDCNGTGLESTRQFILNREDAEEFDDYDAELPAGHYDTHVRLHRGGRWNAHTVNVRKTDKELIQKFLDQGFRIVKPFDEDNEEPKRGITGLNPRRSPELHSMKSHAIDKIDLNKWREYPAEDVMKAVYRRYGKELPSVDSYDWAISWDKKIRPWLKEHEGTF